jgi:hypothetical membrane protein
MDYAQVIMNRPVIGKLGLNGLLAIAGIVGPIVLVVMDIIAATSSPGYSFIRDSISSLAWAKLGWVQTIGFLVIGLLIELFVAGLLFSIRGVRGFGLGIALIAIFGFGLLLVGAFHTDPANGPQTLEGQIHGFASKTIFWLFPLAVLLIAPSLRHDHYWRPLFVYTIGTAAFAVILMIASLWMPDKDSYFGLFERILVADEVLWLAITGLWLLRLSVKHSNRRRKAARRVNLFDSPST